MVDILALNGSLAFALSYGCASLIPGSTIRYLLLLGVVSIVLLFVVAWISRQSQIAVLRVPRLETPRTAVLVVLRLTVVPFEYGARPLPALYP